jgi:hypothetical protein
MSVSRRPPLPRHNGYLTVVGVGTTDNGHDHAKGKRSRRPTICGGAAGTNRRSRSAVRCLNLGADI